MSNASYMYTGPFTFAADDDDSATMRFGFRMRSADISAITRNRRAMYAFVRAQQAGGMLPEFGCNCSHCQNDWDCCGRMVAHYAKASRVKRHLVITFHYCRNV